MPGCGQRWDAAKTFHVAQRHGPSLKAKKVRSALHREEKPLESAFAKLMFLVVSNCVCYGSIPCSGERHRLTRQARRLPFYAHSCGHSSLQL